MKLFVLFLCICPAWAEWHRIDSDHFTVVTDAGTRKGREVARQFEQIRAVFLDQFPNLRVDSGKDMLIFAVRDMESFAEMAPDYVKGRDNVGGVFTQDAYRHYVVLRTDMGDQTYEAVFHEYAHMVFALNWDFLPLWLNEGLAGYFSQIEVTKNEVRLGKVPDARARELANSHFLPMPNLLLATHDSDVYTQNAHAGVFYAQSWLLVHYLYLSEEGREKRLLQQVMNKLRARVPSHQAIAEVLGDDDHVLETLKAYLARNRFPFYKIKTQIRQAKEDYAVTAVSPRQMAAFRGAVAAGTGLATLTEQDLADLAGAETQPGVAQNMAIMAMALSDLPAAVRYAEQAVRLTPDDWPALYVAAQAASDDAARAPYLDRMIAMRPADARARFLRAQILMETDRTTGLDMMKQAVELVPGDFQMRLEYARRLMLAGRVDEGLTQGRVAAQWAPSQEGRLAVTDLMARIERRISEAEGDPSGPGALELPAAESFDRIKATTQPLAAALLAGDEALIRSLMSSGRGVDAVTFFGETQLHLAAETGKTAWVKALLDAKLAVDARDKGGNTPLHLAAGAGQKECVVALLAAGADINAANASGTTPLMAAALAGHTTIVKLLITKKADRAALDHEGYSAIDHVDHLAHKELYRTMRDLRFPAGKGNLKGAERTSREEARVRAMETVYQARRCGIAYIDSKLLTRCGLRAENPRVAELYRDAMDRVTHADVPGALPLLLEGLKLEPENEACCDLLIQVYLRLGKVLNAMTTLEHFTGLSSDAQNLAERQMAVAKAILAEPVFDKKKGPHAEQYLLQALRGSGYNMPQAHYYLGNLYLKFGADVPARDAFLNYLETGDDSPFAQIAEREVARLNAHIAGQ